jgi:hypothetical protein
MDYAVRINEQLTEDCPVTNSATHEVELNFYYLHYNDCLKFVEWSNAEKSTLRSLYARHAILAAVFASEALINRVLNDFYLAGQGSTTVERLSISDKWYTAPLLCGESLPSSATFDSSKQPFQGFCELIKIRNWLVHPKVGSFVDARKDPNSSIGELGTDLEIPWVDTLKGGVWPITRIPLNPFELNGTHAQCALTIIEQMIVQLKQLMPGTVNDDWLLQIQVRDKGTKAAEKLTTMSLWGGYTPDEKS